MPGVREPTWCPYCGKLHESFSKMGDDPAIARPGSLNLCPDCLNLSVYDAGMHLRRPTMPELLRAMDLHGDRIERLRSWIAALVKTREQSLGRSSVPPRSIN
jgi:hypothetical protein